MDRSHLFGSSVYPVSRPLPARYDWQLATFPTITYTECVTVISDLCVMSLLDAAGRIHELARCAPKQYRLTTGPWLYLEGRSAQIRDAMRDQYQAEIVVVMDPEIKYCDSWALDACGIKIWSPGA